MNANNRTVFETEWFSIEEEYFNHVKSLKGKPFYRINGPNGVIMLALTASMEIILVKQFRPALNQYTLEFPCGSVDNHELPLEAVKRELFEETGYVCANVQSISAGSMVTNRYSSREFAFMGTGAIRDDKFQRTEDIEVILVSVPDFKKLVLSGEFMQLSALALLVLADWKMGSTSQRFV